MNHNKVLIVGLDGGTWKVLNPLIKEGKMSNLERLIKRGSSGSLMSTIPPVSPAAWASFQTGVLPSKHGIFDFLQYRPGDYKPTFVSSQDIHKATIWKLLSRLGKKVALIGLPVTYPPPEINGVVVSGLLTPNLESNFTHPPYLKEKLLKKVGDYRFTAKPATYFSRGLNKFLEELIFTEKKRLEAAEWVFNTYNWDIGFVQFQSVDALQHALWPLLDPSSEEFSPEKWERISAFYQFIDNAIGKLLSITGDQVNVLILSDHGFGPKKKVVYLNKYLAQKGWLKKKKSLLSEMLVPSLNFLKKMDFLKLRRVFLNMKQRTDFMSTITQDISIEWAQTRAFILGSTGGGSIYLNLRGREPEGVIAKEEYSRAQEDLTKDLMRLVIPETGYAPIKKIHTKDLSDESSFAPDLLIEAIDGYIFERNLAGSPNNIFETPSFKKDEVGAHYRKGIYILQGPDFKTSNKQWKANIVDIPATLLTLAGVKIPPYFDGKPMESALKEKVTQGQLRDSSKSEEEEKQASEIYSEEDQQTIEKRLRDLGYL